MMFSVKERLILLNILPERGDILSLRLTRKFREALSFSEEEHAALQFQELPNQVKWNVAIEQPKEIEVGPKLHEVIAAALKAIANNPDLSGAHLDLYDRFVPVE
jgi:hypothetical protein